MYRKRYKDHSVKERLPESFVKGLICKRLYVIVQSAKLLQLSEHIYFIRASDDRFYKRAVNKRYDHDKPREQVQIRLYTPYNFFLFSHRLFSPLLNPNSISLMSHSVFLFYSPPSL